VNTIEVKSISYKYKKGPNVLEDLSLSFETGQVYAVLGESGAGKTTLLSLLAGLDVCNNGSILYKGTDIKTINRDRYRAQSVGMIFQQFNLLHRFNAIENILIAMDISKHKTDNPRHYVENLLENIGIDKQKQRRKIIELSGGEQQRVAIVRAIAHQPDIILADEPTGSLDEANQRAVMESLMGLAKNDGKTVIISTHSKEVAEYADCIVRLIRN